MFCKYRLVGEHRRGLTCKITEKQVQTQRASATVNATVAKLQKLPLKLTFVLFNKCFYSLSAVINYWKTFIDFCYICVMIFRTTYCNHFWFHIYIK